MNSGGGAAYNRRAGVYARVGVESGVLSASPHQLITLLFDGAQSAIRTARLHLSDGRLADKGMAISKALDIVNNGLLAALDLDLERGGELSERLAALYDYVTRLLLEANLHNDDDRLQQAMALLGDIGSAWREIDPAHPPRHPEEDV